MIIFLVFVQLNDKNNLRSNSLTSSFIYNSEIQEYSSKSTFSINNNLFPNNEFPSSVPFEIDIVFFGINSSMINLTFLYSNLPQCSQISRFVPLSYLYENYINYSISYNFIFIHDDETESLSYQADSLGNYAFTIEMGIFWSSRTNQSSYRRLNPTGIKKWLSDKNSFKRDDSSSITLNSDNPTIFITNMFIYNSNLFSNNNSVPHTYFLEKRDHDTNLYPSLRDEGKYSPGFEFDDKRWLYLDLSSGPSPYESVDLEYTNFIDYLSGIENSTLLNDEILSIIEGATFSRFLPTYLYEPIWNENYDISIILYRDNDFDSMDYLDLVKIKSVYENLFPYSSVNISFVEKILDDELDAQNWLSDIKDYQPYTTWATSLINFINIKQQTILPSIDEDTTRFIIGIFSTNNITEKEDALGFTYSNLGSNVAKGSVVTISPERIIANGEGLTQTTIHELAHAASLRHPHDYRKDGGLHKFWTWDVCETPLSYLHSVYLFSLLDKDVIYRGNFRYLFNETISLFKNINESLINKDFDINSYPTIVHEKLDNISEQLDDSLSSFISLEYYTGLGTLINAKEQLNSLSTLISNLPNYFVPVTNFDTINNSNYDYGDNIIVSGSLVSYEEPTIIIESNFKNHTIAMLSHEVDTYLFSSNFSVAISTSFFEEDDEIIFLKIYMTDGVKNYLKTLSFSLQRFKINFISPRDHMEIDLTYSNELKIAGSYISHSIKSKIQILYGSYWYVEDRDFENSTYWEDVNKTSGNSWEFNIVNFTKLINGRNSIKVKIFNNHSSSIDTVGLNIIGLPETQSSSSSSSNTIFPSSNSPFSPLPSDPNYTILLLVLGSLIFVSITGTRKLTRYYHNKKIIDKDFSVSSKQSEHFLSLKEKVEKSYDQVSSPSSEPVESSQNNVPNGLVIRRRRKY